MLGIAPICQVWVGGDSIHMPQVVIDINPVLRPRAVVVIAQAAI